MNAVLPDDLSYYGRTAKPGAALDINPATSGPNHTIESDSHPGLEMEPGTEMTWVGPEPLL